MKLGKVFSDNVLKYENRRKDSPTNYLLGWGVRLTFFYTLLLVSFFLLTLRLFHLTVVKGKEHRQLSEENRIQTLTLHAPRGIFYDRTGKALVQNSPAFRVSFPCVEGNPCGFQLLLETEWNTRKAEEKEKAFAEHDFLRQYLFPYETAHVLGYLSEISENEVSNPLYTYQGYLSGDRVGRMGLEAVFEKRLRGIDGKELIEVDAQGHVLRTLGKVDPIQGRDVTLSLDSQLQKVAYEALGENPGAVIVSKPKTGEILALVSTPSFNPNKIHQGLTPKEYTTIFESDDRPLFNRVTSGVYPPGSTYKMIVAVAGLETGKLTRTTSIEDTGILKIGEFSFSNWYFTQYGKTDGMVDVVKALARSNDIFFYRVGEMIGVEKIADWSRKFGLGQKTGIELLGEGEGIVPDPEWRRKVKNEDWYLGDTYHLAIGQGDLLVTPLQVNLWTNALASDGLLCTPTLEKVTYGQSAQQPRCQSIKIRKEILKLITEGMKRACSEGEYQGTGWPFFNFSVMKEEFHDGKGQGKKLRVPVACKTGTAEIGDPEGKTHAWFTAFAPLPSAKQNSDDSRMISGDPEIVVTVLVEKGGEGSSVAAPIAKKIMEEWFRR